MRKSSKSPNKYTLFCWVKLISLPHMNVKMVKIIWTTLVLVCCGLTIQAQVSAADSVVSAFIPHFSYSYQVPGGDVAERYGNNSTIGGGFKVKTKKNFIFSLDYNFIFGNDVKNVSSVLSMVETHDGFIIDGNGTYALYAVYERGHNMNFSFGKILPVLQVNPNSGLMIYGGVGYLLHRLKIDNQHRTAPQISDDYALGYDRLTGGVALNQFVGYFYMGNSRILNFYAGFEFHQAFTKSRRDYIFDLKKKDKNTYTDLFFGIKVGWMIPVYKRAPNKYYYY